MSTEVIPEPDVEVRRSPRRKRTVSAHWEEGRIIVSVPARISKKEEREWVETMTKRLLKQERRRRPTDEELSARAEELSQRYLDGRVTPASVTWVDNQAHRWGSTTPADGTIRLSSRLKGMPPWVIDYVLVHELVHFLHIDHGPEFWAELESYPYLERARGFLEGVDHVEQRGTGEFDDVEPSTLW